MDKLRNIYAQDIERKIQSVIKVDDEYYISQELEEYVVTEELQKHFKSFFDAYNESINGNNEKMGVWISGFFGSGKSHFLKILSYLLENKVVNGKDAVNYFDDKIDDKMLLDNIKRVGSIPTDVILFNIGSKAETTNGSKDIILDVFEKVFNEKMGLSITPFVAEIERYIIKERMYEEFKKEFFNVSGQSWEDSRNGIQFIQDKFAMAYSNIFENTIEEANKIIDRTEKNYSISVEKFAERVRDYIKCKEVNHHVIFLVDEIGQYIGDNGSLMLNLQTIVEDLGLECGGKSWVIVTSQEAIDDIVKVRGNDFSKIQGRFDTKLSLSSSDIDEIIKKRILAKNGDAQKNLELIYYNDESIIRNLLTFKNANYQRIYVGKEDFADNYPFIPYQFKLLQDVFNNIRKHGYSGKHVASGERSLLGAFQKIAIKYADCQIGTLIPFYAFYDNVEEFLDHQVKNVIKTAIDMVTSGCLKEIDIKVLIMLFMLKNIKEISANIDNLATLYVSNIIDDKISIKEEITESLKRLEKETLIERNHDVYKFLTDEEQEINREIKQKNIESSNITDYLKKIVFDYIYVDNKITYKKKPFLIARFLDDSKQNMEHEIGIKVITTAFGKDDIEIIRQSEKEFNFVFVKLEISPIIYDEIISYLQVEAYRRDISGIQQTSQVEYIIRTKEQESVQSETRIKNYIEEQLNVAEILIAGDTQNINSKEAKIRINDALMILINNIYTKFTYISHNYGVDDIKNLFYENMTNFHREEVEFDNQKAYDEIKLYCEEKNVQSISITIRTLIHNFESLPYGFLVEDILYLLTRLMKNEVVSLIYFNEVQSITSDDTLTKIIKKEYYDKIIIKIRKKVSLEFTDGLRKIARNLYNEFNLREDEDGLVEDFKEKCLTKTCNELKTVLTNYLSEKDNLYQYPGKEDVDNAVILFESLLKIREVSEFYKAILEKTADINTLFSKIELILDFFKSKQREHFDLARNTLLIYDSNKDYTDKTIELTNVVQSLSNILNSKEPYSEIRKLPELREELNNLLVIMYDEKSKPILEIIRNTIFYIENEVRSSGVDESFGTYYINICKDIIDNLEHSNELKDIYAQQTRVDQLKDEFINNLENKKNKANESLEPKQSLVKRKFIRTDNLMNRSYEINSKEDIDKYVEDLKTRLLKEFAKNNNLTIR